MIHYDTLLQNATAILLQNATGSLLQNASGFFITKCDSFITKCESYCKLLRFYFKMRHLLQNVTFITNCDSTNVYSCIGSRTIKAKSIIFFIGKIVTSEKEKDMNILKLA